MNIETRKLTFIQEFLRLENEDIVIGLEKLLHKRKAELIEKDLKPMSLEKFNSDIDQSYDDYVNNDMITAKNLKNKFQ
ncbi:hypothetical protein [Flavobacterium sp.]|jgi:hypothetical protein|uniref:hypothetical protein n=1 Tax=Flavobacterium sp. TaxID=239 RepID=UPI0037BFFF71